MEDDIKVQLVRRYGSRLPWEVVLVSDDSSGVLILRKTLATFAERLDAQQYIDALPNDIASCDGG